MCLRGAAVKLCNISGAPRTGCAEHCSDSLINSSRCCGDTLAGVATAGAAHSCRRAGHGCFHHADCHPSCRHRYGLSYSTKTKKCSVHDTKSQLNNEVHLLCHYIVACWFCSFLARVCLPGSFWLHMCSQPRAAGLFMLLIETPLW